jgi:hypothetical protein
MNAIVESKGIAAVFNAGRLTIIEPEDLEPQREDTGLGYMEFFDWLAGTSDTELKTLFGDHMYEPTDLGTFWPEKLSPVQRESLGKTVWEQM